MKDKDASPVFRSFDPDAELEITSRNLPHWFQVGAAMFVTFRTADSLPKEVLVRWQKELEHWLLARDLHSHSLSQRRLIGLCCIPQCWVG